MPIADNLSESFDAEDVSVSRTMPVVRGARGLRRVLVCLDRSPSSETCLPYAISLARVFGSHITLLYVMQPVSEHAGARITDPLGWEVSRREVSAYLDRLAKEANEAWGLPVVTRIEQGRPAERITATAREIGADLTVMASHGEGGATAWSLGSTAQQVLSVAHGSVLLTRAAPPAAREVVPKRILVPLDGSLRTESVLPTAVRIAGAHAADVLLVMWSRNRCRLPCFTLKISASRASSPRGSNHARSDTSNTFALGCRTTYACVHSFRATWTSGRRCSRSRRSSRSIWSCSLRTAACAIRRDPTEA